MLFIWNRNGLPGLLPFDQENNYTDILGHFHDHLLPDDGCNDDSHKGDPIDSN